MFTYFNSVLMNSQAKSSSSRPVTVLIDDDLNSLLEQDMAASLQAPDQKTLSKGALIRKILRCHYTGNFNV